MNKLIGLLAVIVTLNTSAYTSTGNPMANGEYPHDGACAVDRINGVLVPFNTKIILPNGRTLVVKDRFGDLRNNCLDIWMQSEDECWEWGRRNVECRIELP